VECKTLAFSYLSFHHFYIFKLLVHNVLIFLKFLNLKKGIKQSIKCLEFIRFKGLDNFLERFMKKMFILVDRLKTENIFWDQLLIHFYE